MIEKQNSEDALMALSYSHDMFLRLEMEIMKIKKESAKQLTFYGVIVPIIWIGSIFFLDINALSVFILGFLVCFYMSAAKNAFLRTWRRKANKVVNDMTKAIADANGVKDHGNIEYIRLCLEDYSKFIVTGRRRV